MILKEGQRVSSFNDILINILLSLPIIATDIGMCANLIVNFRDVIKATRVAYVFFGVSLLYFNYCIFVFHKLKVRQILTELQMVLDQSKFLDTVRWATKVLNLTHFVFSEKLTPLYNKYLQIEKKSERFTRYATNLVLINGIVCLSSPFIMAGICYLNGTYTQNVWYDIYPVV